MSITFNCEHCGKSLTTSDDKAGRQAKCPGCGEVITVPEADFAAIDRDDVDRDAEDDEADLESMEDSGRETTCPMCGARNPRRARTCGTCGEQLEESARPTRTARTFDAGEVISTSWTIFKSQMGIVIGAVLVAGIVTSVVAAPSHAIDFVAELQRQQGQEPGLILVFASLAITMVAQVANLFLQVGVCRVLLKVARGQEATIGEIFSGGKYFLRMLGSSIVFGLIVVVGMLACIVPGVLALLMFWPYVYVLVDEDPDGIGSLWRAKEITQGNWGSAFVLGLAASGINILGMLACCVGLIFTAPLTQLFFAVAYCRMTGRRTAA